MQQQRLFRLTQFEVEQKAKLIVETQGVIDGLRVELKNQQTALRESPEAQAVKETREAIKLEQQRLVDTLAELAVEKVPE